MDGWSKAASSGHTRGPLLVKRLVAGLLLTVAVGGAATAAVGGNPDLQGVWKLAVPTRTMTPVSGPVPFTTEGAKQYAENRRLQAAGKFDDYDIMTSRCSNPGVPRLMLTPERFKIWQQDGVVTFDYEWNRALRQIDTRGAKTDPPLVPATTGPSKGQWEGGTLVATTTDLSDRTLVDDLVPHGGSMKVTERFRLVNPTTLEDRITIEDPEYFTRPWTSVVTYKRQPDALFPQDVCLDRHDAHQPAIPVR